MADLGPGGSLKPGVRAAGTESQKLWPYPPIPPETQDLVRRTLEVAIDQELTETGVKGLVGWVQDGHRPEEYPAKGVGSPMEPARPNHGPRLEASAQGQKPVGAPQKRGEATSGQLEVGSEELETADEENDEEDEEFQPIPWSENIKKAEYLEVPVSRVRINSFIAGLHKSTLDKNVEMRIPCMKSIGRPREILVRSLSPKEKKADAEHDFELFDGLVTFKAAQILGWETLQAMVYPIDEWEGIRLFNIDLLEQR